MPRGRQRDLGQNFLTDEAILDAETSYAGISTADTVLEVGAGPGNLTERLARRAGHVIAIEYDRQFRARLDRLSEAYGNVTLIWGDALAAALPPFSKVVANLPYQVALPVMLRLLDHSFDSGVLIIQKDMAQRICAGPGDAGYGRVSVTVQRLARTELVGDVPSSAFSPPPRVDSAIVRIRPVGDPFPVGSGEAFRRLLDNAFLYRDEKLGAALGQLAVAAGAAVVLPGRLRGKRVSGLTPEEFGEVSRFLDSRKVRLPAVSDSAKRRARAPQPRPARGPQPGPARPSQPRPRRAARPKPPRAR
jgi:16S rRNA (adenine1518-N6/adenine1519-N6)-dimethyltransferase